MDRSSLPFRLTLGLGTIAWLVGAQPSLASSIVPPRTNTIWQRAVPIKLQSAFLFGRLTRLGEARWYTVVIRRPTRITVDLAVPLSADLRFAPRLVVYRPDPITFGPLLPMAQPPKTVARVYPSTAGRAVVEALTQTEYRRLLRVRLDLPTAGRYYLALYNPSRQAGTFRLNIRPSGTTLISVLDYPRLWWYSQVWSGWGLISFLAPLTALVIVGLTWIGFHRHAQYHIRRSRRLRQRAKRS